MDRPTANSTGPTDWPIQKAVIVGRALARNRSKAALLKPLLDLAAVEEHGG